MPRSAFFYVKYSAIIFALCATATGPCWARADTALDGIVDREQGELVSPDFQVRLRALEAITAPMRQRGRIVAERSTPHATAAITELFRCELAPCPQVRGSGYSPHSGNGVDAGLGEAYSEYFATLTQAVGQLHDPAAIPLLYRREVLTSGVMATEALAYFGRTEAPRVIQLYKASQSDLLYHTSLLMVIYRMLAENTIVDPMLRADLENTFYNLSFSPEPGDRLDAVRGLSYFDLPRDKARLQDIATSGPWRGPRGLRGQQNYDLRDSARPELAGPDTTGR